MSLERGKKVPPSMTHHATYDEGGGVPFRLFFSTIASISELLRIRALRERHWLKRPKGEEGGRKCHKGGPFDIPFVASLPFHVHSIHGLA